MGRDVHVLAVLSEPIQATVSGEARQPPVQQGSEARRIDPNDRSRSARGELAAGDDARNPDPDCVSGRRSSASRSRSSANTPPLLPVILLLLPPCEVTASRTARYGRKEAGPSPGTSPIVNVLCSGRCALLRDRSEDRH